MTGAPSASIMMAAGGRVQHWASNESTLASASAARRFPLRGDAIAVVCHF
jgi:hypothetical protein